jgi:hypothetical protein
MAKRRRISYAPAKKQEKQTAGKRIFAFSAMHLEITLGNRRKL